MGKSYDAEEVSGFMGDLCSSLNGYRADADKLENAYNKYANNDTFRGVAAIAAKRCIDRGQRNLHKDNLVVQKKALARYKDMKDLFEYMVDSSPKARIDTDVLEGIKKDFQGYRKVVSDHGFNIEQIANFLQNNYSAECEVDFTQPSYQEARDAYSDFSGPNGFIDKTIKKFDEFDTDACEAVNRSGITAYIYDYQQAISQTSGNLLGMKIETPDTQQTTLKAIRNGGTAGAKAMVATGSLSQGGDANIVYPGDMDIQTIEKGTQLLAAFGKSIGKGVEEIGLKAVELQPDSPYYYRMSSMGIYGLFEMGGAIQSFVENHDFSETEKNAMKNYKAFQKGEVKVASTTVSGIIGFPDLVMKINKVSEDLFKQGGDYLRTHNITEAPGAFMDWAGEKGEQAQAIWNVLKDEFDEKTKTMSVEEWYEAAGYVAATIGSFYLLGQVGNASKAARAGEAAEVGETVESLTKVGALAEKTEEAVTVANEAEEAANAANKLEETANTLKVLEDTTKTAEGVEKASEGVEVLIESSDDVERVTGEVVDDIFPKKAGKSVDLNKIANEAEENVDSVVEASKRPSWRQSEIDAANDYPNYRDQVSFKDGQEVPYGTKGSVRPDYYNPGSSIDIKNYNLDTQSGRTNLARNIEKQYYQRLKELPAGTKQSVQIDVRGQNISDTQLESLYNDIMARTENGITVYFKK